jgi:kynurenine formamidase
MLEGVLSGKTRVLDLAHAINDRLVPWPGDQRTFEAEVNASFEKHGYYTRSFWMLEHYGTHLDAPVHFVRGAATLDQLPPQQFFGPCVVLDVREQAEADADFAAPVTVVDTWEKRHGEIPAGAIVLLRTGWASRWPDAQRYRNQDAAGRMHFPGFSVRAVERCIERKASGIGCDTMSVDLGVSQDFPVHVLTGRAGLYHLENLSDLGELPEKGAWLVVAPIKLEGGSGGPVRVFALLP